jgi:hypothetical protein
MDRQTQCPLDRSYYRVGSVRMGKSQYLCKTSSIIGIIRLADKPQIGTCLYLIDTYAALTAASAIAANGFLRYALGATFPLFTIQSTITFPFVYADTNGSSV